MHLLRSKAVLMPGVTVTLLHEKTASASSGFYKGGLRDYLMQTLAADPIIPLFEGEHYADGAETENFAEGEGAAGAWPFTDDGNVMRESYVNLIPTPAGGTHESGLKDGLFGAVKGFIELHSLLPKGVKLMPEDVFSRASFVLGQGAGPAVPGPDQGAAELARRGAAGVTYVKPALELWLNQHVDLGKKLAELVIKQAQTRQRAGQKVEKRKGSGVAVLPGKLTDCESRDIGFNELFLVEGDSAGGSAKMGRDKETQAILPLRGKVLNAWEVERDRLFANTEIHDIAVAVGVDPHGPDDEPDFSGLRYGKVCILSDADVDGSHIQVLLLTLFFRHFPKLIERGHVYVAQAAAVPRRCAGARQEAGGQDLRARRGRADRRARQAAQGRRAREQLDHQPLQGPGRDECRAAVGHHAEPRHAAPAAGELRRAGLRRHGRGADQADGQGRGAGAPRADGAARRRRRGGGGVACDSARPELVEGPCMTRWASTSSDRRDDCAKRHEHSSCGRRSDLDFVISVEQDQANLPFITPWERPQHEGAIRFPDFRHFIVETGAGNERVGFVILQGCRNPHRSVELKRLVLTPEDQGHGLGRACVRLLAQMAFRDLGRTASGST